MKIMFSLNVTFWRLISPRYSLFETAESCENGFKNVVAIDLAWKLLTSAKFLMF